MELISVIIPVYNVEKYLNRCIDSVLEQEYNNLEIILVNDGSNDTSGYICDMYKEIDSRIKVVHKKNGGLSSARNAGLDIAKGDYITFLDSDDWVNNKYIFDLYYLLKTYNADISIGNYEEIFNDNQEFSNDDKEIHLFDRKEALHALTHEFYKQMVISCGKLFNAKLFESLRFPLGKIHEDEFVAHKLYNMSELVVLTNEKYLYYWQREDSITGKGFKTKNKIHALEAFEDRKKLLVDLEMNDSVAQVNKAIFSIYREIYKNDPNTDMIDIRFKIKEFKNELKKSRYDLIYRIKIEAYYLLNNWLN